MKTGHFLPLTPSIPFYLFKSPPTFSFLSNKTLSFYGNYKQSLHYINLIRNKTLSFSRITQTFPKILIKLFH